MEENRFDDVDDNDDHLRHDLPASRIQPVGAPNSARTSAQVRARPFAGKKEKTVKKSKPTTRKPPPKSERDQAKSFLPDLNDGGRWSLENEGYGWKVRRIFDVGGTTQTKRYFRIRWVTWDALKGESHDAIRTIFAEKVYTKKNFDL